MIDWSVLGESRRSLAPHIGPFAHRGFLETWSTHFASDEVMVAEVSGAAWAFTLRDGLLSIAGNADVTDYHSPLGGDPADLLEVVVGRCSPGTRIAFDSLPLEAAEAVAKGIERLGIDVTTVATDSTMVLTLAGGDHLDLLDGKQRHEIRRKSRRFVESLGEPELVEGAEFFDAFVEMHRAAAGDKGHFMTESMASFFRDLLSAAGARLDALVVGDGRAVGAAFGFEDDDAYYLYNSAFEPSFSEASPGIVLLHRLIGRVNATGSSRFDFLKGTETYKRRLGAVERPLYTVEGVV